MSTIQLNGVTGATLPYSVYICDVYGNNCVLAGTINTTIPPYITFYLPPQFNTAPALGIKIVDSIGCEKFRVVYCSPECTFSITVELASCLFNISVVPDSCEFQTEI